MTLLRLWRPDRGRCARGFKPLAALPKIRSMVQSSYPWFFVAQWKNCQKLGRIAQGNLTLGLPQIRA